MALPKYRFIFLDLSIHCFIAMVLGAAVYLISGNLFYTVLVFIGGVFIDIDHFIDYFLYFKKLFNLKEFFGCRHLKSGRVYLILHSWEIIFIILIISSIINNAPLLIIALSMSAHVITDTFWRKNKLFYFLSYRIAKKFNAKVLLPEFFA